MRLMGVATAQHSQILDVVTRKILIAKRSAMFRRGWICAEPLLQKPSGGPYRQRQQTQPGHGKTHRSPGPAEPAPRGDPGLRLASHLARA